MTIAVIGATGRVGSEIVRGVLARGDAVTALVRDPGKARRAFGEPGGLRIRPSGITLMPARLPLRNGRRSWRVLLTGVRQATVGGRSHERDVSGRACPAARGAHTR